MNQTVTMLAVTTVPTIIVPKGFVQVIARTRATTDKESGKKKEIAADQKCRAILMPELTPNVSSKYVSLVTSALGELAKAQLSAQWEQDASIKEVPAALYTEDALLAYGAREAESKKLTGASILQWFEQSELCKEFQEKKYSEGQIKRFRMELENIAAPVLSADFYNEEKALKRIATIGKHERDTEHETAQLMVAKLQRFIEKTRKMREEIGSLEEIPE
jgi:hypothetical protein